MQEFITTIQNDSTLMLIVGVSFATFLVIFLVLLISAMRIKNYKDSYRSIEFKHNQREEEFSRLENELKVYIITDQKNKKELVEASAAIEKLQKETKEYIALQQTYQEIKNVLEKVENRLKVSLTNYKDLEAKQKDLQNRHDTLMGENSKYRSNNARLLSKLENSKR